MTRGAEGKIVYPAFNTIEPATLLKGLDWAYYVDVYGTGWHYDQCCQFEVDTIESPFGVMYGLLMLPSDFAVAALKQFPDLVTKLTETEMQTFYDNHAHVNDPALRVNEDALKAFYYKVVFNITLTAEETANLGKAMNENDLTAPGLTKNIKKKWSDYKAALNIEIV